jgi:hypothetical protein
MGFLPLYLAILAALGLAVNGADANVPLLPSQDPWYTSPPEYQSASPGTILRLRHAPGNLTQVMGNCSSAYNILYRTTNSRYEPSWAVTTLYIPSIISVSASLLSYQVPYNSMNVDASPSYSMYSEPISDVSDALGRGWFVTVPDFEGPLAANVAGIQEGHATIDSIRASISSNLGLSPDTKVALWGYSGGSISGEWALELQEQYAPELQIHGAAFGGLVANSTRCIDVVQKTPFAYIAIGAMLGPLIEYPEAYDRLVSQLKTSGPYNKTGFLAAQRLDAVHGFAAYYNQSIYDYFVNGSAVLHDPPIRQVLMENEIMTYHGVPKCSLYIYKAIRDEATPIEDSDAYVERNCLLGTNILYERNTIGGHLDEDTNGNSRAVAWLESIFNGSYPEIYQTQGCTIRNVTIGTVNTGT